MLKTCAEEGCGMTKEEYQQQVGLLGKEPKSYEEAVNEKAKLWLSGS